MLRYALSANGPEAKDSDFTWADFQSRNNNELVAIFGNFVNRAVVLTEKNYESKVPNQGILTDYDQETLAQLAAMPSKIGASLEAFRFREALSFFMDTCRIGNKYLAETEPWKIKDDPDRKGTILNIGLQIAANLSILAEPFLPFTAQKLRDMLGFQEKSWQSAGGFNLLKNGQAIQNLGLLFEKIEDATVQAQVQKLLDTKIANELANKKVTLLKEEIQFDDFAKMDIRVGTIIEAEKVAKSKKLLKLKINDGLENRIVLSGIAEHFEPSAIIGQQVCFLANLAPRKMMNMESQGMILMAENIDGSLAFLSPSKAVWNGATVN